jgi:hypothetical protein
LNPQWIWAQFDRGAGPIFFYQFTLWLHRSPPFFLDAHAASSLSFSTLLGQGQGASLLGFDLHGFGNLELFPTLLVIALARLDRAVLLSSPQINKQGENLTLTPLIYAM